MSDKLTSNSQLTPVPILAFDLDERLGAIDHRLLRRYRLDRVRAELRRLDYMGALLSDPMNVHYATGTRNMPLWTMHAPGRYAFVATDGPVVLFEFGACQHVSRGIETVDELRTGISAFYFFGGRKTREKAAQTA
jgi:Xaa-Pro aminopeptidase